MALIEFMIFSVTTRRLEPHVDTADNIDIVDLQCSTDPDLGWVFGHWDHETQYVNENGDVATIGDGGPLDPGNTIGDEA